MLVNLLNFSLFVSCFCFVIWPTVFNFCHSDHRPCIKAPGFGFTEFVLYEGWNMIKKLKLKLKLNLVFLCFSVFLSETSSENAERAKAVNMRKKLLKIPKATEGT